MAGCSWCDCGCVWLRVATCGHVWLRAFCGCVWIGLDVSLRVSDHRHGYKGSKQLFPVPLSPPL